MHDQASWKRVAVRMACRKPACSDCHHPAVATELMTPPNPSGQTTQPDSVAVNTKHMPQVLRRHERLKTRDFEYYECQVIPASPRGAAAVRRQRSSTVEGDSCTLTYNQSTHNTALFRQWTRDLARNIQVIMDEHQPRKEQPNAASRGRRNGDAGRSFRHGCHECAGWRVISFNESGRDFTDLSASAPVHVKRSQHEACFYLGHEGCCPHQVLT